MTVRVVTLQFGAQPYFEDSRAINAAYCERHELEFCVRGDIGVHDRSPIWSKVAIVANELASADLVLYMDADAVFVDHERTLDEIISLLGARALLFGRDISGLANTGVFLARRGSVAGRVLTQWWASATQPGGYATRWPLEQGAFNRYILGRHSSDIALPTRSELDLLNGNFIRHHAGGTGADKARKISRERALTEWPSRLLQYSKSR